PVFSSYDAPSITASYTLSLHDALPIFFILQILLYITFWVLLQVSFRIHIFWFIHVYHPPFIFSISPLMLFELSFNMKQTEPLTSEGSTSLCWGSSPSTASRSSSESALVMLPLTIPGATALTVISVAASSFARDLTRVFCAPFIVA